MMKQQRFYLTVGSAGCCHQQILIFHRPAVNITFALCFTNVFTRYLHLGHAGGGATDGGHESTSRGREQDRQVQRGQKDNKNDWKRNRRGTFVVAQRKVRIAGNRRIQGEIEAVSAHRFVFVHGADGLDDLRTPRRQAVRMRKTSTWIWKHHCGWPRVGVLRPPWGRFATPGEASHPGGGVPQVCNPRVGRLPPGRPSPQVLFPGAGVAAAASI